MTQPQQPLPLILVNKFVVSPTHLHHPLKKATIIDIPFKHGDSYKIKLLECNSIFGILPCEILPYDLSTQVDDTGPSLPHPWFKHKALCTRFLTELMAIPKHHIIIKDGTKWKVQLGHMLQSKSKQKTSDYTITNQPLQTWSTIWIRSSHWRLKKLKIHAARNREPKNFQFHCLLSLRHE